MPTVESLRVAAVEGVHPLRKPSLCRFDEEVVVVAEQTVGVDEPSFAANDSPESRKEKPAIPIVPKDRGPLVPSADHVIKRAGKFDSQRANHLPDSLFRGFRRRGPSKRGLGLSYGGCGAK